MDSTNRTNYATAHTNIDFQPDPVLGVQIKDSSVIQNIIADHIETVGYLTTPLALEQAKANESLTVATTCKTQYEPILDPTTGQPVPVFKIIFEPDGTVKCLQNLPITPDIALMLYNYKPILPLTLPPATAIVPSQAPFLDDNAENVPVPPPVPVEDISPPGDQVSKKVTNPKKRSSSAHQTPTSQVFQCYVSNCKKEFGDTKSRVHHELRCELKELPCLSLECDYRFSTPKMRSEHVRRFGHGMKCSFPECGAILNTPMRLKAHEKKCQFSKHVKQELDLKVRKEPVLTKGTEEENGTNEYPNVNVDTGPVDFVTENVPGGGGGADDSFDVVGILQEAFEGFSR